MGIVEQSVERRIPRGQHVMTQTRLDLHRTSMPRTSDDERPDTQVGDGQ